MPASLRSRSVARVSLSALTLALALPAAAAFTGCSGGDEPTEPQATGSSPTFHKDVEPILQKSCMGCHSAGNIAPFSLTAYDDARAVAALMVQTTKAGTMPPFAVRDTDECSTRHAWKGDIRLSDAEISTLEAWSKAGTPKGDPKDAPASFVPKSPGLPGMTLEVHPNEPYVTSGEQDEFRCFIIDPGLTEDQYLNGLQMVPGNHKVVHHGIISIDPEGKSASLAGPDGSFPCGAGEVPNGVEIGSLQMLTAWAPGADPVDLPEGVGQLIPKGSLIMMQIHYHPAGTTADPDLTRVQLRLTKEKPKYGFLYHLIGNFDDPVGQFGFGLLPGPGDKNGVEFLIPADSKNHVETEQFTVPAPGSPGSQEMPFPPGTRIYGDFLHMHYLGFDEKVTVTRANGSPEQPKEECLAHAPKWEFGWQRSYSYDAPIETLPTLEPGDVLQIRCTYNNSTENPYVVKALKEAKMISTIDVAYGEGSTFDEMCVAGLSLVYPMP
ncbi:hypothetical protein WMF11_11960 [Sorangium sp. So ce295]|jgi:hypothetical protein